MKAITNIERTDCDFLDYKHVMYYITGGCKFKCAYCDTINNDDINTDLESQKTIIDTLFELQDTFEIYLYGGEPSEYMYIHELIEYILQKKSPYFKGIEMQTNLNISVAELERYCDYGNFRFSPSIHITFLKGDTIHTLIDKLSYINSAGKLDRIDLMLEKWKVDDHITFIELLKDNDMWSHVVLAKNFYEFNKDDNYTGKWNSDRYNELTDSTHNNQESYQLAYDDNTTEDLTLNQMVLRKISFKGWFCDARKYLTWLHFNGDWWECNVAYNKKKPMGNILTDPKGFIYKAKYPVKCDIDYCTNCFFVKKWKKH